MSWHPMAHTLLNPVPRAYLLSTCLAVTQTHKQGMALPIPSKVA